MSDTTETPLRERLARLGPFIAFGDIITDARGMPGFRVACAFRGLPNIPSHELAALIAKLLNEYVNTPAAS